MCIVFFNYLLGGYKFIAASNRDEYFHRPTKSAEYWPNPNQHVFGGLDLEPGREGGTWLGVSNLGKFGVLTNYREPESAMDPEAVGRGPLCTNYLSEKDTTASDYVTRLSPKVASYNGFNLVLGDFDPSIESQLYYVNNREGLNPKKLEPGTYGLCNKVLDSPWEKVINGKAEFTEILAKNQGTDEKSKESLINSLVTMMANDTRYPDKLPDTGKSLEWELFLSSIFVKIPENSNDYGTRATTIILLDNNNKLDFLEVSYNNEGVEIGRTRESFHLQPKKSGGKEEL